MQKRRKPQRQCIGCRESKDKNELVRVVKTPEGEKKAEKVYVSDPEEITSFSTNAQGQYHRISIYNKELTQEEIINNFNVDKERFNIK